MPLVESRNWIRTHVSIVWFKIWSSFYSVSFTEQKTDSVKTSEVAIICKNSFSIQNMCLLPNFALCSVFNDNFSIGLFRCGVSGRLSSISDGLFEYLIKGSGKSWKLLNSLFKQSVQLTILSCFNSRFQNLHN